jgi:hypothetical protein
VGVKIGAEGVVVVVVVAMLVQGHGEVVKQERLGGSAEGQYGKVEGQVKRNLLGQR